MNGGSTEATTANCVTRLIQRRIRNQSILDRAVLVLALLHYSAVYGTPHEVALQNRHATTVGTLLVSVGALLSCADVVMLGYSGKR